MHLLHIIDGIGQKFRQIRNATVLFSFGIFLCLCVAGFLTFISFVTLFTVIPFCLIVGAPIQFGVIVVNWVVHTLSLLGWTPLAPPRPSPPPTASALRDKPLVQFRDLEPVISNSPWLTPLKSALASFKDSPSPFPFGNSKPLPPVHSDTLDQISTPLIISVDPVEASPNVLGLNFVESPTDYTAGDTKHINYLEILPDKVINEILSYLPFFYIGILALVSKDLASRVRFRRVHSGTEYCPLSMFNEISRRQRLGEFTKRLVIHRTFYRPPIRAQWLLEGSDPNVVYTSWKTTETKKHTLLVAVLKSCRRISSLTWNEGRLPLPPLLLKTVELRLGTTLRHLDISAKHNQLVNHINGYNDPSRTLQLSSIVIRDGFTEDSMIAITQFLKFSTTTIRQIHFKDGNFGSLGIRNRPPLFDMLRELPRLERVDFTRPLDLDTSRIPITHMGLERGLTLNIQDPTMTYTPYIRFEFFLPIGHILSNLTALLLYLPNHINTLEVDSTLTRSPISGKSLRSLAEVVSAAINLRVFAFIAPVPAVLGPKDASDCSPDDDPGHAGGSGGIIINLSSEILEALITKDKLISLSLMARMMTPHQLQQICENLRSLSHLGVFMSGESIHVSKYSQHFTKLSRLVALDVAIRSFDQNCPCGHEMDPRFPHYEEGTAMGRLCRRFLPRVDMNGQRIPGSDTNKHLKVARLSRLGWHYDSTVHEQIRPEISWLSPPKELVDQVESMWGPCEVSLSPPPGSSRRTGSAMSFSSSSFTAGELEEVLAYSSAPDLRLQLEREAVRRIFSPVSWAGEFSPGSLSQLE